MRIALALLAWTLAAQDLKELRQRADQAFEQKQFAVSLDANQAALKAAQALGNLREQVTATRQIGLCHSRQGNPLLALKSFQAALALAEAVDDPLLIADILRVMGVTQRALGQYPEALTSDLRGVSLLRPLPNQRPLIRTLNNLSVDYQRLGDARQAVQILEEGWRLAEKLNLADEMTGFAGNIGILLSFQGDAAAALGFLELEMKGLEAAGAPPARMADCFSNIGPVYQGLGRLDEARQFLNRAVEIARREKLGQPLAYALVNRASVWRQTGRPAEALRDLHEALTLLEHLHRPADVAETWANVAWTEVRLGHPADALAAAERAVEIARRYPSSDLEWQAYDALGQAHRLSGDQAKAAGAFASSVAAIESWRRNRAGGELQGQRFFAGRTSPFYSWLSVLVDQGQTWEALRVAERSRAQWLLDAMRVDRAAFSKVMSAGEREQESTLSAELSRATAQLAEAAQPDAVREHWRAAAHGLEVFQLRWAAAHPELRVSRSEAEPVTLAEAGALLPDALSALLEYAVHGDQLHLFVITRDAVGQPHLEVLRLKGDQSALERSIETFRRQLASRDLSFRASATALYRQLLAPAAGLLRGRTRLGIIPDGPLWGLPFPALLAEDGRFLIESRSVYYAPSLTVLREGRSTRPSAPRKLLAMGDPATGRALPRLPHAARETAALGRLYGEAVFTGQAATEDRWKAQAAEASILHLATHGVLNSASPMYSYVALARDPQGKEDGMLEAREILELPLRADLVVLSACETARGRVTDGEGIIGMSWAFQAAGVPAALVSQWKVDSESTTQLMLAFYGQLVRGGGPASALQSASRAMLRSPQFAHPYYWAGFALLGQGRVTSPSARP